MSTITIIIEMKSDDQLMVFNTIKTSTNIACISNGKRSCIITSARAKMPSIISHYYSRAAKRLKMKWATRHQNGAQPMIKNYLNYIFYFSWDKSGAQRYRVQAMSTESSTTQRLYWSTSEKQLKTMTTSRAFGWSALRNYLSFGRLGFYEWTRRLYLFA